MRAQGQRDGDEGKLTGRQGGGEEDKNRPIDKEGETVIRITQRIFHSSRSAVASDASRFGQTLTGMTGGVFSWYGRLSDGNGCITVRSRSSPRRSVS